MRLKASHLKMAAFLSWSMLITACGSQSNSTGNNNHGTTQTSLTPLRIDALGVAPLTENNGSYIVRVNNYSNADYTLESIMAVDSLTKAQSSASINVNGKLCSKLVAKGNCSIQFTPQSHQSMDVILLTKFKNNNTGQLEEVNQLIRMSDKVAEHNGIKFASEIGSIVTLDGNYSAAIPLTLTEDFENIKALNGSLLCNSGGFHKGSSCTYLIQGKALADNTLLTAKLTTYKKSKISEIKTNILVHVGTYANLIISHGKNIADANGHESANITIFNNGTAEATDLKLNPTGGLKASFKPACNIVPHTIGSNSCMISATAVSELSGSAEINLEYKVNNTINEIVSTSVHYIGAKHIGLLITEGGDSLTGIMPGEEATRSVTITNNGNRTLHNLNARLTNADNSVLTIMPAANSGQCNSLNNFELVPNAKCNLLVKYRPSGAQGLLHAELFISGLYQGANGQTNIPFSSRRQISYSSISDAKYLALENVPERLNIVTGDGSKEEHKTMENFIVYKTVDAKNIKIILQAPGFIGAPNKHVLNIIGSRNTDFALAACDFTGQTELIQRCNANVIFGLSQVEIAPTDVKMVIKYIEGVNNAPAVVISSPITISAKNKNAIIKTKIEEQGIALYDLIGSGASFSPFQFTGLSNKYLTLKYTFTNIGNAPAEHFNLAPNLPYGSEIINGSADNCNTRLTEGGGNCWVVIKVPSQQIIDQAAFAGDNIGVGALSFMPNISYYNGSAAQGSKERLKVQPRYINYSRNWAQANYTIQNINLDEKDMVTVKILATINLASLPSTNDITVSIKDEENLSHFHGKIQDAKSCLITPIIGVNSCEFSFKIAKNDFPAGNYYLVAEAIMKGMAKDPILNVFGIELPDLNSYQFQGSNTFALSNKSSQIVLHYSGDIPQGETLTSYIHTGFALANPESFIFPVNPISIMTASAKNNKKIIINNLINSSWKNSRDDQSALNTMWEALHFCKNQSDNAIIPGAGLSCAVFLSDLELRIPEIAKGSEVIIEQLEQDLISHATDGITHLEQQFDELTHDYITFTPDMLIEEKVMLLHELTTISAQEKANALQIGYLLIDLKAKMVKLDAEENPLTVVIQVIDQISIFSNKLAINLAIDAGNNISQDSNVQECHFTDLKRDCRIDLALNEAGVYLREYQMILGSYDPNYDYLSAFSGSKLENYVATNWGLLKPVLLNVHSGKIKLTIEDRSKFSMAKMLTIQ